ncbi:MAG: cyclic pyranopterin monophosphate synthase MoaC [Firmicutes bacterium]|uniref:cyclic pyranopterin monophosphate synthase n=1 Tax=Candidatus Stercoripulliclostridium pullicola TaxID=2840953 RepID=A0A940DGL4_9FIRM|nr:cyclic pyranopterin monophosphate synthase MoaC [Candidatus Stercoripulliclostridium pullicola]
MELNHFDGNGNARMADVSNKDITLREAVAKGRIKVSPAALALIAGGNKKGNVLTTATVAGVLAAKRTFEAIPMCHVVALDNVEINYELRADSIEITAKTVCHGRTGAEMEALHAVSVAALTIYDMLKAADKSMAISDIRLVSKTGGKSGDVFNI